MPESLEDFLMTRPPTAERPLLGQTVLVVEDSRFACEALRMICQRSGARIRRADCLKSAARHLRTYRPGIVLVDLGLPDGSGLDLIRELSAGEPRLSVIIAMTGDDGLEGKALAAGADAFISKPIRSISAFQSTILKVLPKDARPIGLRPVSADEVVPDRIAYRDDLALVSDLLTSDPDEATLHYLTSFLIGLAKSADDPLLAQIARDVEDICGNGPPAPECLHKLKSAVDERLELEQQV